TRLWPSGPGTILPRWTSGFDSRQALLLPCDGAGVPACLSNRRDGFDSRTGRSLRAEAERRGDRLIRGGRQVRLLPARLTGERTGAVAAGFMCPTRRLRLPFPRLAVVPWSSPECSPRSHRGGRWFKSSRDYWSLPP